MRISDWSSDVCSSDLDIRFLDQSSFAPSPHARHLHRKPCCHVTGHAVRGRPCAGRDGEVLLHGDIGRSRRDSSPYLERTKPLSGFRLSRTHHRSEERRVGQVCVSTCSSWWSTAHEKKKN